MASRDLLVRVLGDSKSVERAFARSSAAANRFDRSATTSIGRVDTAFTRLNRLSAGGFVGGTALLAGIGAITKSVQAAAEAQQVLGQTQVALEATGKSWVEYGDQIEKAIKTQSRLGFDDEALLKTFSLFQRRSGDVGEALRENSLAADIARARFISLEQAANLVNKAALGQAGALRRLGIDTKGATTGTELLTLLTEKYGGSAKKAAGDASTSFDRAKVSIENAEEAIGKLLIPTVTLLADNLADAADTASTLITQLGKLGKIRIPTITIPFITKKVPGTGSTVGDLVGDVLSDALDPKKIPLRLHPVGQIALSLEKLGLLDGLFDTERMKQEVDSEAQRAIDRVFDGFQMPQPKLKDPALFGKQRGVDFGHADAIIGAVDSILGGSQKALNAAIAKTKRGLDTKKAEQVLETQRKALVDLAEKQRKVAEAAAAALQAKQFRALGLSTTGDEIVPGIKNLQTRIQGALKRIGSGQLDVTGKLEQRLKLARTLIKREGGKLTEDTRRTINDLIQTVTSGIDKLDKTTKATGPLTKTTAINTNRILDGLGLGRDAERELRARLSRFNSAGQALTRGNARTGSFVGGRTIIVENHNTIELDSQVVAKNVTKSQTKTGRGTRQKRGPNRRQGGV